MPHTAVCAQASHELHVGQKQKGRPQIAFSYSLCSGLSLAPLSLYLTRTLRASGGILLGPRLILAGELWANPVRWLSQSTDKQRENLVMHWRLIMSQVVGTANRRGCSRAHSHQSRVYPPPSHRSYMTPLPAACSYNGFGCFIIAWAIKSCFPHCNSVHLCM